MDKNPCYNLRIFKLVKNLDCIADDGWLAAGRNKKAPENSGARFNIISTDYYLFTVVLSWNECFSILFTEEGILTLISRLESSKA